MNQTSHFKFELYHKNSQVVRKQRRFIHNPLMSTALDNNPRQEFVFVYGTLRQGGSNAWRMEGAAFLTSALALGHLYRVDWYPGAIFDETAAHSIVGEIYHLTPEHLQALDQFEGEEYERIKILVTTDTDQRSVWAWEYQHPTESLTKIPNGDWLIHNE